MQSCPPSFPSGSDLIGNFRQGNRIYTVYNGDPDFMLDLPKSNDVPTPEHHSVDWDLRRTNWIPHTMPYLIFLPRHSPFYGPIFRCLSFTRDSISLAQTGQGWCLSHNVLGEWVRLEKKLRDVLGAMQGSFYGNACQGLLPFAWPSRFDYCTPRQSRSAALAVSMRARDAFLPLMAHLTLMFFLLDLRISDASWRVSVLERAQVEPTWFADFESSVVGDMSTPRLGGILDFSALTKEHPMDWLVKHLVLGKHPVPLYFFWGEIKCLPTSLTPIPPILTDLGLLPTLSDIAYLQSLPSSLAFSSWRQKGKKYEPLCSLEPSLSTSTFHLLNHPPLDHPHSPKPIRSFPPIQRLSGQKEGENVHTFMTRREEQNALWEKKETPQNKTQRLARAAHASEGAPPGKKGARVYIWEESDGCYLRTSITHEHARDIWDHFTPKQRRYDSFSNTWDLCEQLAPDEGLNYSCGSDDGAWPGTDIEFPRLPGIPDTLLSEEEVSESVLFAAETEKALCTETAQSFQQIEDDMSSNDTVLPSFDMSEVVSTRFGFTTPIAPPSQVPPYDAHMRTDFAARSIGDEYWRAVENDSRYICLKSFLTLLAQAKTLDDIPRELLDLRQNTADIYTPWAVHVGREHLNGEWYYSVRPQAVTAESQSLHILLRSAATVLLIVRMGWAGEQDIIKGLLTQGAEFHLCIRAPPRPDPEKPQRPRYSALGFRPAKYVPTKRDYVVYQERCSDFFHSPRGIAARLAGGIVGRLARLAVKDEVVCLGPSDAAFETGISLWDQENLKAYVDIILTPEELDLTCGAYVVATGQASASEEDGLQKKTISWWPKPSAFSQSGLNIGWWSPDCERWFQKRLSQIRHNNAPLFTQSQWKNKIRYIQKSREVSIANETIAAGFLDGWAGRGVDLEEGEMAA